MRPVDKTGLGTYPYAVDVSTQADLETTLQQIKIPFGSTAKTPITNAFGVPNPSAWDVINGLITAKGPKPKPKKKAQAYAKLKLVKGTITTKLGDMYAEANLPLQAQLGRYCSFCEMPTLQAVAVEHIVPKAPYPLFYIAWDNFLLACSVCNSCKGNNPPRSDLQFTPQPADEVGYFDTIKNTYLWPNGFSNVYKNTKPQLQYQGSNGNWFPVTNPVQPGTAQTGADVVTRTITANVYATVATAAGPKLKLRNNVPVRVQLVPVGARATNMLELAALNKPSGLTVSDIRMWTRTELWFTALNSLNTLKKATVATFPDYWDLFIAAVPRNGLYSVYVTLIDLLGPSRSWLVPGTTTPMMKQFLDTIVGPNYFPGTDTADAP